MCCLLCVVSWLVVCVCCRLFVVVGRCFCLLFGVRGLLVVGCWSLVGGRWLLVFVGCMLIIAFCLLVVVCCLLIVVR